MCRTQRDLQLICLTLFFNDLHRLFFTTLFQCLDRIPEAVDTDVFHLLDLFSCDLGEGCFLIFEILCKFRNIFTVIADTLDIRYDLQDTRHLLMLLLIDGKCIQFNSILCDSFAQSVCDCLFLPDLFYLLTLLGDQHISCTIHGSPHNMSHSYHLADCRLERNTWCLQHSVVQKYLSFIHIVRIFSLQFLRQLNDPVRYREEQDRSSDIKNCVNCTDLCLCDQGFSKSRIDHFKEYDRNNAEDDRTDDVEQQMHHSCCLCCLLCPDTGHDGSHTGTDILSHDNVNSRIKRNQSCCRKTL